MSRKSSVNISGDLEKIIKSKTNKILERVSIILVLPVVKKLKYLMEKTSVNIAELKLISKARFSPA